VTESVKATRVRTLGSSVSEPSENESIEKPIRAETGEELDALVEEHDLVLAEFYTKGCARCDAIEPVLGNVARATDVVVVTINPVTDLPLVEEYDVTSVPALVLFEDGERVGHLADGFQGTEELLEFVAEHASRDPTAAVAEGR
jgi:thioredoxin 1